MTKSDLINLVATKKGLTLNEADMVVDTIFDSMADTLVAGNRIEIRGFGSFEVKEYEGYTGRNPKTGELVVVNPKKQPFFKAGKDMKERVNGSSGK